MLNIKNRVSQVPLGKEILAILEFHDSSAQTGTREKHRKVKCGTAPIGHRHGTPFEAVWTAALERKVRK
jgi:hypothetical protein